jgi:hypothetical protein
VKALVRAIARAEFTSNLSIEINAVFDAWLFKKDDTSGSCWQNGSKSPLRTVQCIKSRARLKDDPPVVLEIFSARPYLA